MAALTDEERNTLCDVIRRVEPDWYRAYELRQEGTSGPELAAEFDLPNARKPRAWANVINLLLGTSEFQIGDRIRADRHVRMLCDRLLDAGGLDRPLLAYVHEIRDQAEEAIRARQAEDEEEETDLEEESIVDVAATQTYQIYAWTYSGIPNIDNRTVVKIGLAAAVPKSNAWRRMEKSARTTGSPGAPTMLRVWQGRGGPEAARQSELELHGSAGQRILGGGSEWFRTDLQQLDSRAEALGLERHFAVNPA